MPSPDRLLTDRGSYIAYLESQLERVSAACLTVQVQRGVARAYAGPHSGCCSSLLGQYFVCSNRALAGTS